MITRPLDLASRLRPLPRGWDALFYVNVGALAVFFLLFGSRFVLAPGLAVEFALPKVSAAGTSWLTTDVVIAVTAADRAVVGGEVLNFKGLEGWLRTQVTKAPQQRLLVQVADTVPARALAEVYALAAEAGFAGVLVATEEAGREGGALGGGVGR